MELAVSIPTYIIITKIPRQITLGASTLILKVTYLRYRLTLSFRGYHLLTGFLVLILPLIQRETDTS